MGPVRISVIAGMLMLCFAASASALSKPIAIGSNVPE